jgi:hypothetical protein
MKNIIKKLAIMMAAFMLMFGAVVNTNVKSVYADDNIITIKFTYVRSDNKYQDYYMKAFMPSGSVDTDGEFMIVDNKAVFECKFQKDPEFDEEIAFRVMEKTIKEAVISGNVDVSEVTSGTIEVVINGDSGKITVSQDTSEDVEGPDSTYTEKLDVGDDPNKDYSVKPAMVFVYDVLFLGALGACVYFVLIKKRNAFM